MMWRASSTAVVIFWVSIQEVMSERRILGDFSFPQKIEFCNKSDRKYEMLTNVEFCFLFLFFYFTGERFLWCAGV